MAEYQISQFAEYINNPGQSRVSSRSSYTTNKQFQHHIHHEEEPIINSPTVSR